MMLGRCGESFATGSILAAMKEYEHEGKDDFWSARHYLFTAKFPTYYTQPQKVWGRFHTSEEQYHASPDEEIIPIKEKKGKCMYYVASAFAEMERDILIERTQAGLQAARARGRKGGRPKTLTPKKAKMLQELYRNKENSIDEICKTLNISRTTFYRYIKTVGLKA
jgi:helix-turn-helix resolvase-like protein/resolvase-like protein